MLPRNDDQDTEYKVANQVNFHILIHSLKLGRSEELYVVIVTKLQTERNRSPDPRMIVGRSMGNI
jgi:hypothetical protein